MYDYKEDLKKLVEDVKRKERDRIVELLKFYSITDVEYLLADINNG